MANIPKASRVAFKTHDSIRTAELSATTLDDLTPVARQTAPPMAALAVHPSSTIAAWASMDNTIKVGNVAVASPKPLTVAVRGKRVEDHQTALTLPRLRSTASFSCGLSSGNADVIIEFFVVLPR